MAFPTNRTRIDPRGGYEVKVWKRGPRRRILKKSRRNIGRVTVDGHIARSLGEAYGNGNPRHVIQCELECGHEVVLANRRSVINQQTAHCDRCADTSDKEERRP